MVVFLKFLNFLTQNVSKQFTVIDKSKRKQLKISEEIHFKMLELEREAEATKTINISTQEALFVILVTQHAPFSRKGLFVTRVMF